MIFIGIDPDFDTTAVCAISSENPAEPKVNVLNDMQLTLIRSEGFDLRTLVTSLQKMLVELIGEWTDSLSVSPGQTYVYIEDPQIYIGKGPARHRDIMKLAQVSAACASVAHLMDMETSMLTPQQWKGNVPKDIHQARTYGRLGISYDKRKDYAVPKLDAKVPESFHQFTKKTDWKHLGDAIGLALYAMDAAAEAQAKATALQSVRKKLARGQG